ncbi:MAG: hypothetical protein QXR19_08340 [Candidatus Jordarchaeaceae archaeon]
MVDCVIIFPTKIIRNTILAISLGLVIIGILFFIANLRRKAAGKQI